MIPSWVVILSKLSPHYPTMLLISGPTPSATSHRDQIQFCDNSHLDGVRLPWVHRLQVSDDRNRVPLPPPLETLLLAFSSVGTPRLV